MRLHRLLLPALIVPGLLAAPTLVLPAAAARPVPPGVVVVPLEPAPGRASLRTAAGTAAPLVLTEPRATDPFEVVGLTWDPSPVVPALDVQVRTRSAGDWSPWTPLEVDADAASGAEAAAARPGTAPLWVGEADGVQARVAVLRGEAPTGLRLSLVDPGDSPADDTAAVPALPRSSARAAGSVPAVRPRSAWGADESMRGGSPSYASRVKAVTLHHTASSSSYEQDDVPRLLRGFYAYHVKSNGWSDIGYNFLVDRFGTVWEGRAGGTGRAVIGAHAGGFNTGTVGVSMIGTYESVEPSAAMREAVAQVAGWKLGAAGVDPEGFSTLTSAGSTRYSSGTPVRLANVFGHKAVSTTSCPGTLGTAALPGIRSRAAALAAGAAPQAPEEPAAERDDTLRVETPAVASPGTTVEAVVRGVPSRPVQLWFSAGDGHGATLRREGVFDADGAYRTSFPADSTQVLFAVSDGRTSARARTQVGSGTATPPVAAGPLAVTGPVTAAPGSDALVTVTGPPGTTVSVWFRSGDEDAFVKRRDGRTGEDGRWTTTYTAGAAQEYFAMSSTLTSPDATTQVGAVPHGLHAFAPAVVDAGTSVPLVVQGTPGSAVELWFSRAGGPFSRRREGVLAPDGTFRTTWAATDAHTVYAVVGGRTSTRVTTAVTGGAPAAPADAAPALTTAVPEVGDAGAPVELVVNGRPGAPVSVWFRPRGEQVFALRRSGTFDAEGVYRTAYTGSDDQDLYATSDGAASVDDASTVRPVLAAPATARLTSTITLTGRARPGDSVVVEQTKRSNGAVVRRTTTAGSTGTFRLPVWLGDESVFRPVAAGRVGTAAVTTRVTPVLTAPATAGRGSTVRLSGTARPGALVEVLVRKQGGTAFTVARRLTADASGRFATTAVLSVSHRLYARADGLASGQRIVQVR